MIEKPHLCSAITGFVYDERYLLHDTGPGHPETADRLRAIVSHLEEKGLMAQLARIAATPAEIDWITTIHSPQYVRQVERRTQAGERYLHSADTCISRQSYEAARLAVGGVIAAADAVIAGRDGIKNAFCAVRPPGHHALADQAMGFCLFNNVAIAARYLQRKHGLVRVLIVDWDVHHGNGTQDAFYNDPSVMYFSIHQYPAYPGTGSQTETGNGKGEGFTVNVPLSGGAGDGEYISAFEEILKPKALAFKPEFVIISAGFDAYLADPLGGMSVTTDGFARMTSIVKDIAETCAAGRLVSVLEGGYNLAGSAECLAAHLTALGV